MHFHFRLLGSAFLTLVACGSGGGAGAQDGGSSDGTTGSSSGGGLDAGSSSGSGSSGGSSGSSSGGSGGGDGGDGGPVVGASVLMYHNHLNRDGTFIDGAITAKTAPGFKLDTTFKGTVSGNVYTSPLYVEDGVKQKGTFYVATEGTTGTPNGSSAIYALDEATGATIWHKDLATPPSNAGVGCGNIHPIGVTGTPAIDLSTRLIVFDAPTADGSDNIATRIVYGMSIDDGTVKWKVDVSTLKDTATGLAFSPQAQNQRGAVLIVGGIAYVVYGGHSGDCGTYHGWVVGVPLTGKGAKAWATKVGGAGIWGPGGAASDGQSVFVSTGNGIKGPVTWSESEGIFRLDPGPSFTGQTADYFAPYNWQALDDDDGDISGSGPLVIDAPAMKPTELVMAQGKDGYLYLMDRSNLGGIATSTQLANVGGLHVQSGEISNGSAWATIGTKTYVFVRPNGQESGVGCPNGTTGDLVAVLLDPSAPQKMSVAWCAATGGIGSPIVTTSNGTKDALVWTQGADGNGQLRAFDLATGAVVNSGGGGSVTGVHHFSTIAAVHGKILAQGDGALHRWAP